MKNNSECIFEVIGNNPVVDQFDILYTSLLSGSTYDNYITGTLFSKVKLFGKSNDVFITSYGERGLAFNRLGTNRNNFPGDNTSYELQSWGERSGFIRNIRLFSSSEKYADSEVPDIEKMLEAMGSGVFDLSSASASYISIGLSSSFGPYYGEQPAYGFQESFPFESKFSGIQRIKKIENRIPKTNSKPLFILERISPPNTHIRWYNSVSPASNLKEKDIGQILFGFGDRRKIFDNTGQNNLPETREVTDSFGIKLNVGPIIRGWKYGLVSASPYYTSAVFRRDKFGQFRDMLEQRPVVASRLDQNNSPLNYFGDTETPPIVVSPSPPSKIIDSSRRSTRADQETESAYKSVVEVKFVKPTIDAGILTYTAQQPLNTLSSNLSQYATSSLPFFDGTQGTNRPGTNLADIFSAWSSLSTLNDNFGNLLIGTTNVNT